MPIRVNLKEIFPSDSQEITVDKVNFNFNKLLELGVGDPGIQGISGIQGPAGPIGLTGSTGLRGSTWFVDVGDPNTLTGFVDLIDNDLYLDSLSFDVWQYDLATDTWNLVTSISTIINNYLATTSSPFRRGIGLGSPNDDRFITFNRRGETYLETQLDVNLGTLNTSTNDTLFLNNFNEDVLTASLPNFFFTTNPGELFNSLLSIYSNHSEGAASIQGRYHLEMGSLYENTEVSPSQVEMSDIRHNLKAKFLKEDVSSSTPLTSTNYWLNIARFSISKLESAPITTIDQNGQFEFVVPKYNNEGMSAIQSEVTIRLGSAEALIEQSAVPPLVPDGISISSASNGLIFGLREGLENDLNLPYSAGNADFALFDVSSGLNGFFFNDRLIQTAGNIEQIHTTAADFLSKELSGITNDGNANRYYASIFSNGKYLIRTYAGPNAIYGGSNLVTNSGQIQVRALDSELTILNTVNSDSVYSAITPIPTPVDNHGHPTSSIYADVASTSVTDVKMAGKYLYFTRVEPSSPVPPIFPSAHNTSTFIIAEIDSSGTTMRPISYSSPESSLQRVEIVGPIAYVINKREIASPWSTTDSKLISIDISDPTNPVTMDSVGSPSGNGRQDDNYLDLEISGEKAFVSAYAESDNSIRIKQFDIHDPYNLTCVPATNPGTIVVVTGATEKPAQLKAIGTWLFCSYDKDVYVYDTSVTHSQNLALVNSFEVDPNIEITDIIVNDRYLYVLGENKTSKLGMLATVDISDILNPFTVAIDSRSEITAPGKMTMVGNKIYVSTSQGTGTYSATDGGLSIFEVDGFVSSGANIARLKSDEVKITKSAHIGESLEVGNSINVGQGGVYIDRGQGLSVDGQVKIRLSDPYMILTANPTSFSAIETRLTDIVQTSPTGAPKIYLNRRSVNTINLADELFIDNFELDGTNGFDSAVIINRNRFAGSNTFNGRVYGFEMRGAGANNFNSDYVGADSSFGSNGSVDVFDLWMIGYNLGIGADVTANSDIYGLKVDINPGATIGGTAYGVYAEGTEANRLDGTTTINAILQLTPSSQPLSPTTGMVYYDSGSNTIKFYNGTAWKTLSFT